MEEPVSYFLQNPNFHVCELNPLSGYLTILRELTCLPHILTIFMQTEF